MGAKKKQEDVNVLSEFVDGMSGDKTIDDIKIQPLSDAYFKNKIKGVISTQCATLDGAIGRGGVPMSRLSILHGLEGSGKTTVALHIVAETQRRGGVSVFFDKENKLDPDYAEKLNVDLSKLFISSPKTLEGVVRGIKAAINRAKSIREKTDKIIPISIIVDSLNACKAFETIETPTGKKRYPAEARIWSEELPDIIDLLSTEYVSLIFISQVRKKLNVVFGNDQEMAGGFAPRFYASLIIKIVKVGTEKDSDGNKNGSIIKAECVKNQIHKPFEKAPFSIFWNRGIDYEYSLVLQLEKMGVVKKMKATKNRKAGFVLNDQIVLGRTYTKSAKFLRKNLKVKEKMIELMNKEMGW